MILQTDIRLFHNISFQLKIKEKYKEDFKEAMSGKILQNLVSLLIH